jgi:hypothetical protein
VHDGANLISVAVVRDIRQAMPVSGSFDRHLGWREYLAVSRSRDEGLL